MAPLEETTLGGSVHATAYERANAEKQRAAEAASQFKDKLWGRVIDVYSEYVARANLVNTKQLPTTKDAVNGSDQAVRLAGLLEFKVDGKTTLVPYLDFYSDKEGKHQRQMKAILPDGSVHDITGNAQAIKTVSDPDKNGVRRELLAGVSSDLTISVNQQDRLYIGDEVTLADGRKASVNSSRVGPDVPSGDHDDSPAKHYERIARLTYQLDKTPPIT